MSDAPEVGVASHNPSRTEVSNSLANGQHHSPMEAEIHRGMGGDSQSSSDIDSAGPLTSSSSTSVAQGEKLLQRQREPIKSTSLVDSSVAAQMKTVPLNQNFPSEKVEAGQGSPGNLSMNTRPTAPSPMNQNSDNKIHLNAAPPGLLDQSSSVSSMPSSNGPPEPAMDAVRRSPMLTQPSNSPGNKMRPSPIPPGSSGPASQSVRPALTASVPSSQGAAYSSSPSVLSSQPSPAHQLMPGVPKPSTSLPNSTSGPVPPQSLAGPTPTSSGAFKPLSSAGPFPSQPSAGPFQTQSMAPQYQTQPSAGQFIPQSGPYPPQSLAGTFPSQPSSAAQFQPQPPGGGQFPPQSSSGPFPSQSSAGHFAPQYSTGQFQSPTSAPQSAPAPFQAPVPSSVPPLQSSGSFPPPSSVAPSRVPPQPYGSFSPNNPGIRPQMPQPPGQPFNPPMPQPSGQPFNPPMPQPSGQPFNPPMPQPSGQPFSPPMPQPSQFPPQSTNAFPGPQGPFTPSTSYGAPLQQPSQYIPGPQPNQIPPSGPYPVGGGMPPRQPLGSQYAPRPPPQTAPQSGGWAQANGIPNQTPSMDTITRQPVPSGVPMYPQGPQQMPQGTQPSVTGAQQVNDSSQFSRRYPPQQQQQPGYQQYPSGTSVGNSVERMSSQFRGLSVARDGFNKLWGADCYDLLQSRYILPAEKVAPPKVQLHQEYLDGVNCRPEIFRCTLTKIPETNSLLQKSRLPLGILIHPFKDVNNLPVVQCNTIVRCRACRTYINPFVYFVDHRRWKCNLCFRVNDMPEEFQFDPVTKTYGDPSRRPEIRSATIEYIAPSEYMLRPPQAAVYLFLLDVSCGAVELGYLHTVCDVLSEELSQLPGDSRTQIGFIAYDSALHFFVLAEGLSQPQHLVVSDTTEVFLPRPDNLLVNLQECKDLAQDLLAQLPSLFLNSHDTGSALGPALQAAYKLMAPTGGRVTVFQTCLPSVGAGALKPRGNDGGGGSGKEAQHINPATDFYKRLALDCSGQQVAVDLFVLGKQYTDLATLSGVSQFSGGCIHHLPHFDSRSGFESSVLERSFHRYLSRKIGFEAVMRIRCSRGLSIHTFHGHFFVRSTDLLSLPNVNPDAGYGMQVAIDESLSDLQNVCFQAALLYTSSKGERRIRVHTLCLPLAANVNDVVCAADQQCIVGLLAKMAVDRCHQSSPADARDAFINVATDVLSTYRLLQTAGPSSGLLAPHSLRLLPLYILALLKHVAFRAGQGTRLDERVFAMCQMKCLPLSLLMQEIYPDFYPIHNLGEELSYKNTEGLIIPCPPRYHLSAEKLDSRGVFLMDRSETIIIYVGRLVSPQFCQDAFGVPHFAAILDDMYELPVLENPVSELLNNFIRQLQSEKPYEATIQVIREDSHHRMLFIEKLVEDRSESALSYYEFLQHLKAQVK